MEKIQKLLKFMIGINALFIPIIIVLMILEKLFIPAGIINLFTFILNETNLIILYKRNKRDNSYLNFLIKRENKLQVIEQIFASGSVDLEELSKLVRND